MTQHRRIVLAGPLLYHFADMPNETSIELSYEELKKVILKFNFEILVCNSIEPGNLINGKYIDKDIY